MKPPKRPAAPDPSHPAFPFLADLDPKAENFSLSMIRRETFEERMAETGKGGFLYSRARVTNATANRLCDDAGLRSIAKFYEVPLAVLHARIAGFPKRARFFVELEANRLRSELRAADEARKPGLRDKRNAAKAGYLRKQHEKRAGLALENLKHGSPDLAFELGMISLDEALPLWRKHGIWRGDRRVHLPPPVPPYYPAAEGNFGEIRRALRRVFDGITI